MLKKECYSFYELCKEDNLYKEQVLLKLGITMEELEKNAMEYSYEIDPSGKDWKRVNNRIKVLRVEVYKRITSEVSGKEVLDLLERYNGANPTCITQMKTEAKNYVFSCIKKGEIKKEDEATIISIIRANLDKAKEEYLNRNPEKKYDRIANTREIVSKYLNSEIVDYKEYLASVNMTKDSFYNYVSYLREINDPMYDEFLLKKEKGKSDKEVFYVSMIYDIMQSIKNGIDDGGVTRPFDLIDYYNLYGEHDYHIRKIYSNVLNSEECKEFGRLIGTYYKPLTKGGCSKQLLRSTFNVDGYIIDHDKVEYVIKKLEENKTPITEKNFFIGVRRFIIFEDTKKKILEKK